MVQIIEYENLANADLIVNAVYEGRQGSHLSGEALSNLLPGIGNLGGFRPSGKGDKKKFVVLSTSGEDKDWPDRLDLDTGKFIYYGDNRKPGTDQHDTSGGGNRILCHSFELLHVERDLRKHICPFLVFQKHPTPVSARSFQFKGLAVPGSVGLPETADLIAFWTTSSGQRFLNYRATFTILDARQINRAWIYDLQTRNSFSEHAPPSLV